MITVTGIKAVLNLKIALEQSADCNCEMMWQIGVDVLCSLINLIQDPIHEKKELLFSTALFYLTPF